MQVLSQTTEEWILPLMAHLLSLGVDFYVRALCEIFMAAEDTVGMLTVFFN